MTKVEIVEKAIEVLNKVKGLNYQIADIHEDKSGTIILHCIFPNGTEMDLQFIKEWFVAEWDCGYISNKAKALIADNASSDEKKIMKIIAGFGENRDLTR